MAKRFYDNLPPGFVPLADTSNAKELYFKAFDSGYAVGTAGTKGVGRSQTLQLFHGSEAGYWPNAEEHSIGVLQAIGREEGTEIIIESTANGIGNYYHNLWKSASGGSSEYQAIFLPWYWQDEYSVQIEGFKPYEDEQQLLDLYAKNGMTEGHLAWRRLVIADFSHNYEWGVERFKSQYPNNANEAFQNPIDKVFIDARYVMKARTNDVDSETGLIIGIDPAISNHDRTAIIRRRGRLAYQLEAFRDHNTMEICGLIKRIVEQEKPVKIYVDMIGIGAGIVDRCQEMGLTCVEGVNVARSANQKEKYINLRAELWDEMKKWLEGEMPVQIPDDDEFQGELCSVGFKHNSNNQLKIESKDELKSRGMPSPDCADALMLTFYSGQYAGESAYEVNRIPIQHARGFM